MGTISAKEMRDRLLAGLERPTADLGEDGELVAALRKRAAWQRENLGDMLDCGTPNPELEQAAARIEQLREALERIAAEASVSVDSPTTMCAGWRGIAVERIDIARAVLSRSGF